MKKYFGIHYYQPLTNSVDSNQRLKLHEHSTIHNQNLPRNVGSHIRTQ
ncbi:MAG: hypothetical protein ACJAVW_000904, partial [Spirosomataceae bacterium]